MFIYAYTSMYDLNFFLWTFCFYIIICFYTVICLSTIVDLLFIKKSTYKDFPCDPVVKTLISNAGGAGSIPGQAVKIPHAL